MRRALGYAWNTPEICPITHIGITPACLATPPSNYAHHLALESVARMSNASTRRVEQKRVQARAYSLWMKGLDHGRMSIIFGIVKWIHVVMME